MTKEEIVKYVMQSPENTNPAVLEGMLNQLDNGGGGDYKFVEVVRQEEFEWTQAKGDDWMANNNSFDVDTLEKNIYAIKMPPYINDFTSVYVINNSVNKFISTDSFSNYSVTIGCGVSDQNIYISPFESVPEVESIILYKIVD